MATQQRPDDPPLSSAVSAITTPENEAVTLEERDMSGGVAIPDETDTPTDLGSNVVAEPVPVPHPDHQDNEQPSPHSATARVGSLDERALVQQEEPLNTGESADIELVSIHARTSQTGDTNGLTDHHIHSPPSQPEQTEVSVYERPLTEIPQVAPAALGEPETTEGLRVDHHSQSSNESHALEAADPVSDPPSTAPHDPVPPSWRPLSFSLWSLPLLTALTLAANTALLYLFIISETNQGVAPVADIPVLVRRFVPTAGQSHTYTNDAQKLTTQQ